MLDLAYFDGCHTLLHLLPHVVEAYRPTHLLILLKDVLEVGSDSTFNVGCDLNKIFAINDSAQLLVQVLIGALNNSGLHSKELLSDEWHALPSTVT